MSIRPKNELSKSNDRINEARQTPAEARRGDPDGLYVDFRKICKNQFIDEAYKGDGGFSGETGGNSRTFIIPNATENFFSKRVQMSKYTNYFKKFVDAKCKPIFASTIQTYVKNEQGNNMEEHLYLEFLDDVTGSGMSKQEFEKIALKSALKHDVSFVIMDILDKNVLPHVYFKPVKHVMGYTTDDLGALTSITFYDGTATDNRNQTIQYKRYIGLDKIARYYTEDNGKSWRVESEVENVLGVLPVKALFANRDETSNYKPEPSNFDIGAFCAWIYDKSSKLDYLIDKQAHSRLVIQGRINDIASGLDNCINIAESDRAVVAPNYLSPSAEMPQVHQNRIDAMIAQMFQLMEDSGVSVTEENTNPESGVAKSYRFNATNTALKSSVSILNDLSDWMYWMYKIFTFDTSDWYAITEYPTDFTPSSRLNTRELIELIEFYEARGLTQNVIDMYQRLRQTVDPHASREETQGLIEEVRTNYEIRQGRGD